MKVLYITHPYYSDSDITLMSKMQEFADFHIMMETNPQVQKSMFCNFLSLPAKTGIYKISDLNIEHYLSKFAPADKVNIMYRASPKLVSFEALKARKQFKKFLHELKPDLIHYNGFTFNDLLCFSPNKYPCVNTVHDPIPHSSDTALKTRILYALQHKLIRNKIILNSTQRDEFIRLNKFDPKRVIVSKFGAFDYMQSYLPKDFQEPKERKTILFFGRIEEYKGVEYLLEAFNKISHKHPDIKLIIAGKGELYWEPSLHENKPQIEIINRFIPIEELAKLISNASCCVCPYKDATQSGVIMSSYALNVPMIASNVGGIPEWVKDNQNGLLVPPCNADALANALDKYLSDTSLFDKFSAQIKNDFQHGENSWNNICQKLYNFYKICI